jgi:hypothetical protein
MPIFRCFGLTEDNRIIWGRHIEAEGISAAIIACTRIAPDVTRRVEVWLGSRKLHPKPTDAMSETDVSQRRRM